MKHHRAKAPFQAVLDARWWYDNSKMSYESIADLVSDFHGPKEIDMDWDNPSEQYIATSTVRDWINETRAYS